MITCQLKGGFGNQLFQIFAIIAYSLDNKFPFKFFYSEKVPSITPRSSYWDSFLKSLKFFTIRALPSHLKILQHPAFEYQDIPIVKGKSQNICIDGYFQSHKYFEHRKDDIFRLIQLTAQKKKFLATHNIGNMDNTISMHFRLGDYKHLGHTHPIMNVRYYINALTTILSKVPCQNFNVIYFCESEDNEHVKTHYINEITQIFPSLTFTKASDDMADWEQVLYMSQCTHNIIANSSFSWFGAFFNTIHDTKKKNKKNQHIVCYPSVWFVGHAAESNNTKDMFPESWKKIEV